MGIQGIKEKGISGAIVLAKVLYLTKMKPFI